MTRKIFLILYIISFIKSIGQDKVSIDFHNPILMEGYEQFEELVSQKKSSLQFTDSMLFDYPYIHCKQLLLYLKVSKKGKVTNMYLLKGEIAKNIKDTLLEIAGVLEFIPATISNRDTTGEFRLPIIIECEDMLCDGLRDVPLFKDNIEEKYKKYYCYPIKAQNDGIQGRVIINFEIDTNGQPDYIRIFSGIRRDIDSCATEVIKNIEFIMPKEAKPDFFQMAIEFSLDKKRKKKRFKQRKK